MSVKFDTKVKMNGKKKKKADNSVYDTDKSSNIFVVVVVVLVVNFEVPARYRRDAATFHRVLP